MNIYTTYQNNDLKFRYSECYKSVSMKLDSQMDIQTTYQTTSIIRREERIYINVFNLNFQ